MSKAGNCKRNKLLYNIWHSDLSGADKMIYYAMHLKFVDGEQLLEFLDTDPSKEQIVAYIEEKLRENRIKKRKNEESS